MNISGDILNTLSVSIGRDILYIVIGLIIGAVVTFILTKKSYEKQLKENPPITEKQIRAMFESMGAKPTEKKVRQVLNSMGLNSDGSPINKEK